MENYLGYSNITLIHPLKDFSSAFWGSFHPKLWLIKFPSFLRIVIGTGNMQISHWTNWSNCFWFRDFP
jgi:tyrosyl-DNA phosphodiesterase-1